MSELLLLGLVENEMFKTLDLVLFNKLTNTILNFHTDPAYDYYFVNSVHC